jgi:sulfur-oxidizing protein SoxY
MKEKEGTMRFSLAALAFAGLTAAAAADDGTAWLDIRDSLFGDRPLVADGLVSVEAPYRAEDAALVPVTLRTALPPGDTRRVERLTLVIDENPAPVAATFTFGPAAAVPEIATRVRVNAYSSLHAVAELSDGTLHVGETFVKASGGCSAPASKDPAEAAANMGRMKFRQFAEAAAATAAPMSKATPVEAQLSIRHPNNSGLQMDQATRFYVPAHFVDSVRITQGEELILGMEGGISISEDPSFRFEYLPSGDPIRVEVTDTEGKRFTEEWPARAS